MLIELRQALVSYQDDHVLLLTLAGQAAPLLQIHHERRPVSLDAILIVFFKRPIRHATASPRNATLMSRP